MGSLLFSFEGRIRRGDFWKGLGIIFLTFVLIGAFSNVAPSLEWVFQLVSLFLFYPLFAVTSKRYHDHRKSGWWAAFWLIPLIGPLFILIECGINKGSSMKNEFGNVPE